MRQSLLWLLVQIGSKIIKTKNFCLFTIVCCSLSFRAFSDNYDSSTFLHIVLDVIQAFMIQIPHWILSCFLLFFPFTHSHSFTSFCLVFFSLSFTLTHSPLGFLCNYKMHFQFSLCCCRDKQIANNIIHNVNQLRRLRVLVDPSVKPWHNSRLCK
jgi:hypothetical protein